MAATYRAEDWIGRTAARRVRITEEMVDQFVDLSGDRAANHVSDAAAQAEGFRGRVVHGMLLGALLSGVLGTELPGKPGVEQEAKLSFRNPCYPGDEIVIQVAVAEFFASVQTLVLKVTISRTDDVTLATGQIQFGLR
jgi:acyl dehydratase